MMHAHIFAELGTRNKVTLAANRVDLPAIQIELGKKFGGDWVWVDTLRPGEVLTFTDGREYNGFINKGDRYSDQIVKIK